MQKTWEEMTAEEQSEQLERQRKFEETGVCDHKHVTDGVCENCFEAVEGNNA
jgi:hypothetical protein